jgi:serine/threonine-protein phosphatase 5
MGLTIEDANKSIEIDPNYYKAYYRRSSANILLGKYEEALKDLNFLKIQYPNDQSLLNKIKYVKDLNKKKNSLKFSQAKEEVRERKNVLKKHIIKL